ncbi:MAG: V-type ATPase subunit [Oscillospiraceae bacterium]
MPDKVNQNDYLYLSAMLRAREANILSRDRMDRMLSAATYAEAAKILTDCGYEDMSRMDAKSIDAALSRHREAVFDELTRLVPQAELVDIFRLKYDYHNAKVIIKAEGAGVSGEHLFSSSGRIDHEVLRTAYREEDFRFLPEAMGRAMGEAKSVLARTGNPQLADFVLDSAYFAELAAIAEQAGGGFLTDYVRALIDSANLRTAVRTIRMGRDQDFLATALIRGGNADPQRLAQAAFSGGEGLIAIFTATCFKDAAALGAEAMKGGSMTRFELSCDNAVTAFLRSARLISFGAEPVLEYVALVEAEITAVRMILTGRLAGIAPEVIRERLRDVDA